MQKAITDLEAQIAKAKKQQADNETEIEKLREQRAQLFIKGSDTKKIDKQIIDLQFTIANAPAIITVLENQLAEAEAKFAAENRDALLDTQKKSAKELKKVCVEFVALLETANELNKRLQLMSQAYDVLRGRSGVDVLGSRGRCSGSMGSLNLLLWTMKQQVAGEPTFKAGPGALMNASLLQL